jgi:hypothetical protein
MWLVLVALFAMTTASGFPHGISPLPAQAALLAQPQYNTVTWRTRSPSPWGLSSNVVTAANGRIYVVGSDTLIEYDPVGGGWTRRAGPPMAGFEVSAASAPSGHIYAIGSTVEPVGSRGALAEYDPRPTPGPLAARCRSHAGRWAP